MEVLSNKQLLILAYSCEPGVGGEHEVGWRISEEIAKIHDNKVYVLTRTSNQEKIEQERGRNANYHFIESNLALKFKPRGGFSYLYYIAWQIKAYKYIKNNFPNDIHVHLLTFGNIHLPTFLWLLDNSYSMGPMGGGAYVDTRLLMNPSVKEISKSLFYKCVNFFSRINPFFYLSNKKAIKIITRTNDTVNVISSKEHSKIHTTLETGITPHSLDKPRRVNITSARRFINVSRFIESKNIEVSIETFNYLNKINNGTLTYTIIGNGPLFNEIRNKYSTKNIIFLGKVEHEEVRKHLQKSDVMLTCTVKEGGSHAIFEAMSEGCIVACYNISGMKVFPPETASIKFEPTGNIEGNIEGFAKHINKSLEKRNDIMNNAYLALHDQTWNLKAKEIYDVICKSV